MAETDYSELDNLSIEQTGATEGEYEYKYGSYSTMLEKQLEAIKNKAELEKEQGILGTRNMAVLNAALTGRGLIEGARESFILRKMNKLGGADKQAEYDTEGNLVSGTWDYDESDGGFWSNVGKSVLGWQEGVHAVADKGLTMDDIDNNNVTKTIEEKVHSADQQFDQSGNPVSGRGHQDSAEIVPEESADVSNEVVNVPFVDQGGDETFSDAMYTQDEIDEDAGDLKPDDAWDNVSVDSADKNIQAKKDAELVAKEKGGNISVESAVATIKEKKRASKEIEVLKSEGKMELAEQNKLLEENKDLPKKTVTGSSAWDMARDEIDSYTANAKQSLVELKNIAINQATSKIKIPPPKPIIPKVGV